jgi:hypothetical protein
MLTSESIWAKLMNDPGIATQPESVREVMRSFVAALPGLCAEMMEMPANLQNIIEVKLRYLRHRTTNDYFAKIVDALPNDSLRFFTRDEFTGMFDELVEQSFLLFEFIASDVNAYLSELGVSESTVMMSPVIGLSGEARQRYVEGELTIGTLLELQPEIIVKDS